MGRLASYTILRDCYRVSKIVISSPTTTMTTTTNPAPLLLFPRRRWGVVVVVVATCGAENSLQRLLGISTIGIVS